MPVYTRDFKCTGTQDAGDGPRAVFEPVRVYGDSPCIVIDVYQRVELDVTGDQPVVGQEYTLMLVPKTLPPVHPIYP